MVTSLIASMSDLGKRYPNAPIIEAVIDIHTSFGAVPPMSALASCAEQWQDRFPVRRTIRAVTANLDTALGQVQSGDVQEVGIRLATADNSRVLQLRGGAFTYSHLPPYSDWPSFRAEAIDLWRSYVVQMTPTAATRLALRYINRIVVPLQRFELEHYFHLNYRLPADIKQDVTAFLVQLQIPQNSDATIMAHINFALDPDRPADGIAVILDLDVFEVASCPADEAVFEILDDLRRRKNELFEACITDRTRELFQ